MLEQLESCSLEQRAVYEARRDNLKALIHINGTTTLMAKTLGHVQASFMSQVAGKNPSILISETNARKWERVLGLQSKALDNPLCGRTLQPTAARVVADVPPQAPAPSATQTVDSGVARQDNGLDDLIMEAVRDVAALVDASHIALDEERATRVFGVVKSDALARGGNFSVALIGNLLKVLR